MPMTEDQFRALANYQAHAAQLTPEQQQELALELFATDPTFRIDPWGYPRPRDLRPAAEIEAEHQAQVAEHQRQLHRLGLRRYP